MKTPGSIPIGGELERAPSHGGLYRFAAIIELALAFGLVHVAYRALQHFTVFGQWDARIGAIRAAYAEITSQRLDRVARLISGLERNKNMDHEYAKSLHPSQRGQPPYTAQVFSSVGSGSF